MNFLSKIKKFKKQHKNKSKITDLFPKLIIGTYGLQTMVDKNITIEQFNLFIKLLKRCLKGFSKKNVFWIRKFPDIGITKKPKEIRMGRGKGAVVYKVAILKKGQIFLEIRGKTSLFEASIGEILKGRFPFLKTVINTW
jgi:large subunit ribosomal protein L16